MPVDSFEQMLLQQNDLLVRIRSSQNPKTTSDLMAEMFVNIIKALTIIETEREGNFAMTTKQIRAVEEFMIADSDRVSGRLDRMADRLERTATSEDLLRQSADAREQFQAIRKQLGTLLGLVQPR